MNTDTYDRHNSEPSIDINDIPGQCTNQYATNTKNSNPGASLTESEVNTIKE